MPVYATLTLRVRATVYTALAGGIVAFVMHSPFGGDLARYLRQVPFFQISAMIGAGLAGAALCDGFGRARWQGHGLGAVTAVTTTCLGAIAGALIATFLNATLSSQRMEGAAEVGSLGLLAIMDGIATSVPVAVTWVVAMACLHWQVGKLRRSTASQHPATT
ncbi:MAG: hypothetical protein AAF214_00435 [Pseudomonadota bacterium]